MMTKRDGNHRYQYHQLILHPSRYVRKIDAFDYFVPSSANQPIAVPHKISDHSEPNLKVFK